MMSEIPSSEAIESEVSDPKREALFSRAKKWFLRNIDWYNTTVRFRVITITCIFMAVLVASASLFGLNMYWSDRKAYLFENHQLRAQLVFMGLKKHLTSSAAPQPFKPPKSDPTYIQENYRIPRLPENDEVFVGKLADQMTLFWKDSNSKLWTSTYQFRPDSCPTEAGLCYLVTGNGLFLGTSHPHLVTEKTFAERETLIKAVKGGLRGGFRFVNTAGSNQEAAVTYQEAENTNVYIFIETTTTSIVKQAEQFLRRILILGILLVVVMSFALSKIISTILAPITSLKRSFNRIRKGEYQVDINHKYADEFSIMIQDAKVMADTLKERESTILRVQDNLQEILTLTRDLALAETLEQIFTTVLRGIGKNLDITQTAVAGIHLEDELREVTHLEDFSSVSLKPDAKANPTIERALKNTIERLLPRARVEIYVSGPTILIPILSAEGKKFCTLAILNAASLYPTNENLHYIRTLAGSISRLVENILQQIKLKSLSSIESEMKSAASLQSTFLADVPAITDWKFSSFFKPASRVGGDWYAFHNDEGSGVLFLAIGDATGHGLSSALVSVIACSAFHSFLETKIANDMINFSNCDATVTELLDNMDTVIVRASEEKVLMTCILLAIQTATGQVILINGGHRPPIVRRSSGETNAILAKGDILGLKNQKERKCEHLTLQHGDSLVLYSDGLIENTGPKNQIFSGQKLRAAIRADINSANHLLDNIVNAAKSIWEDETAADDVTVISVTRDHPV